MLLLKEAAEKVGLSSATLGHWISVGRMKGQKVPHPRRPERLVWMVDEDELQRAMETRSRQSISMQTKRSVVRWSGRPNPEGRLNMKEVPIDLENDALLTPKEAEQLLGISNSQLYKMAHQGRIEGAIKTENGRWAFSRNGLEKEAERRQNGGGSRRGQHEVLTVGIAGNSLPSVQECLDRLDIALRELKYAVAREAKQQRKHAQEAFQQALDSITR